MDRFNDIPPKVLLERAKELECLYLIDDILTETPQSDIAHKIAEIIPLGFQKPEACTVSILFDNNLYSPKPPCDKCDEIKADIIVNNKNRGFIRVMYPKNTFPEGEEVFLNQEIKLLKTIANRVSEILYKKSFPIVCNYKSSWEAIIRLLQKTDHNILLYVCQKMLAQIAVKNLALIADIFNKMGWSKHQFQGEINFPLETLPAVDVNRLSDILFTSAGACMDDSQIFESINLWIYQAKTYDLIKIVDKKDYDIRKIKNALIQYTKATKYNEPQSASTKKWLTVELIRRFITDNPRQIAIAQQFLSIEAFCKLLDSFISSPNCSGKIGGKAAGFFLANQIIESLREDNPIFKNIKMPKTWYISSDELVNVIEYNNLEELNELKYRDILEIRTGYPRIVQMLKSLKLSSYIENELSQILDSCEEKPLIIRSSSLLEDQVDSSFSGKYKSLFITNTGTKTERMKQLTEGIMEVYASMFSPDSIQYRKEHKMLDNVEQMGIIIQEVVGFKTGSYYFPLYAGVAFSNNELRWSPRLKREDGLVRMVMGLGTRAVDRVGDDFPILVSPGQPNLRVNQSPMELKKYSPQMMDVIDIENNRFLTVPIKEIIKEYGSKIPYIHNAISIFKDDFLSEANSFTTDYKNDEFIITFDTLINKTPMIKQIQSILTLLQEKLGYPVDIEFAGDGESFYLLQCRPQSRNYDNSPVAIPSSIPKESIVFTAGKYVSNGLIKDVKTVVYVDPYEYSHLEKREDMVKVGRAISELNRLLPRRSFILIGPGRWGSRGDIKLGVPVAYSDINNTAMLIEVAQTESKFQPELSFGTHFFQDLIEENIKYLPLYPEDNGIIFNKLFFSRCNNSLCDILPDYSYLDNLIRVIRVSENYYGKNLVVLMNADLEKAVAYLEAPSKAENNSRSSLTEPEVDSNEDIESGWKWRHYIAQRIADLIDMDAFSIDGIYLFGSTNNCTARLNSDIDLLIHFNGTEQQKQDLTKWLNGWSAALSEVNFLRTGYKTDGLLDIHYITDKDIANKNSYAIKINSIYDPAYPLRVKSK